MVNTRTLPARSGVAKLGINSRISQQSRAIIFTGPRFRMRRVSRRREKGRPADGNGLFTKKMLEEESVETVALSFVGTHEGTARQLHVVDRVVRRRHRIDQHLLVLGQRHRSRAFGNVERQQIHVGETVGNVAQVGLVTVRTQIPDLGALHEALAVAVPAPLAVETFP